MIVSRSTLKNWFKTGLKPTEPQFWNWLDSFWHKGDEIPAQSIKNLQNLLDQKEDLQAAPKHYKYGQLQVFYGPNHEVDGELEPGDIVKGWLGSVFIIEAIYLGGPTDNPQSFNILNSYEF